MITDIQPKYNPHKAKPKQTDKPKLSKKDYHWMAWPSPASTPEPSTARAQSARPMSKRELASKMIPRPESAAASTTLPPRPETARSERPKSAIPQQQRPASVRAMTPRMPTPAPPVQIRPETPSIPPTPVSIPEDEGIAELYIAQEPTVAHLNHGITEGRPVSVMSARSVVSQQGGERVATPRMFDPDYRDPMSSPQVTHPLALQQNWQEQSFVPGLQAWVTNANDYGMLRFCYVSYRPFYA